MVLSSGEEVGSRPLFGGMAVIHCPARLEDVSAFRPVPDHQEVLADASSDQSLSIEILVRFALVSASCSGAPLFAKLNFSTGWAAMSCLVSDRASAVMKDTAGVNCGPTVRSCVCRTEWTLWTASVRNSSGMTAVPKMRQGTVSSVSPAQQVGHSLHAQGLSSCSNPRVMETLGDFGQRLSQLTTRRRSLSAEFNIFGISDASPRARSLARYCHGCQGQGC